MKKLLFLLLIFNLLTIYIPAQQISKGPEIVQPLNFFPNRFIGADKKAIYLLKNKGKALLWGNFKGEFVDKQTIYIEKYSKENFNLLFSKEVVVPLSKAKKLKLEEIIFINKKMVLFTSYHDGNEDFLYLFAQYINENGEVQTDYKEIAKIKTVNKRIFENFQFILTPDSSKVLVLDFTRLDDNAEKHEIRMITLNDNLNTTWSRKMQFDLGRRTILLDMDKEENLYFKQEIFPPKDNKKAQSVFKILKYFPSTSKIIENEIPLNGITLKNGSFSTSLTKNGEILSGGFSQVEEDRGTRGIFVIKMNSEDLKVKSRNTFEFDQAALGLFISQKNIDKGRGIENISPSYIRILSDGKILLIGEEYIYKSRHDYKTNVTTRSFEYMSLIATAIDPVKGEIAWFKKILKNYYTDNDNDLYSSFFLVEKDNEVHFIFNDNKVNYELQDPSDLPGKIIDAEKFNFSKKNSVVSMVTLNNNGKMTRKALLTYPETEMYLYTEMVLFLSPTEIILYGDKMKSCKLLKVQF